jgi:hypothetical protein
MNLNHVDYPSSQALTEVMRKVNAYGHAPRIIVELDKFSYVKGLKRKYPVTEYVTKTVTKNIVSIISAAVDSGEDAGGDFHTNPPVMPIQGKSKLSDMVITSRHRTVDPSRPTHKGLDLDLVIGQPVVAAWSGTVIEAQERTGYGKQILIDHGNGLKTRYGHMDSLGVGVGQSVKQGQVIGNGGNSGIVDASGGGDGSHLHFEVLKEGVDINPEPILNGSVSMNGAPIGGTATYTKGTEKVSYSRDFNKVEPYDTKWENLDGVYFNVPTSSGARKVFGINGVTGVQVTIPGAGTMPLVKSAKFKHTWFNDGYLDFSYLYEKGDSGGMVQVLMDGVSVFSANTLNNVAMEAHPAPITVSKGEHTFEFRMKSNAPDTRARLGLMTVKCAEFDVVEKQETVSGGTSYSDTIWDYDDGMGDISKWEPYQDTKIVNGGEYLSFSKGAADGQGMYREGVVTYPFTIQFTTKVEPGTTKAQLQIGGGTKQFTLDLTPSRTGNTFNVDNTVWQDYMVVCNDKDTANVFHSNAGSWEDTGINLTSIASADNRVMFYIAPDDTGTVYADDVKYVNKDFSTSAPATNTVRQVTDQWYDLGGFVFDETFYIEDIMNWEVNNHLDSSSATARVTLSNHHGLYSPEYVRDPVFPNNLRKSPYSYWEEGEVRHVISEYTPVRIYAGYGEQIVRIFTGMIKGEVEEDSVARTVTFNCVDRYDLLEECILLRDTSFPPVESIGGDSVRRPWIKSSIVQSLANIAGMTGWRYVYEDLMHPDLVIEDTYYTDINRSNNTFMKFDSKGKLSEVSLGDVKTPKGYKNPFVEDVVFQAGERVSDCIRRVAEEINFRATVDRYGTFILHHLDFENNMRWSFTSGENLHSLTTSTDYSRVRNHIIISGATGKTENFFDKDLIVATKGHIRTAKMECPWIDETNGTTSRGAKEVVANKLFFDMKRQARTKNVVVKGNPFIEVLDGCYVYDSNTSTAGYYIIKGNTLVGDENGMINRLELTWEEKI